MSRKRMAIIAPVIFATAAALFIHYSGITQNDWPPATEEFSPYPLPIETTHDLMDIGIADVNDDGRLDIFTSNHNHRQNLLVAQNGGQYADGVTAFGLDQDPNFPGTEVSKSDPELEKPGLYIYWKERKTLVVRAYKTEKLGRAEGVIRSVSAINRHDGKGARVKVPIQASAAPGEMTHSTLAFVLDSDGQLTMEIASPGLPVAFRLGDSFPPASVFLGSRKLSPRSREFEIALEDPHGLAWADYNDDGRLDVFVTRGAVGGTLAKLPPAFSRKIMDRLLVSSSDAKYQNMSAELGIEKKNCSGRKVVWVDFDGDGLLDLFINCQDRGKIQGIYPKQLYKQGPNKRFREVAAEAGLDVPGYEIIDYVWLDADNDGDMDLLTNEDTGFYLYRNQNGKFSREFIGRGNFIRSEHPELKGSTDAYWFVDGKVSIADFDGDEFLDVFISSKKGNALLVNDRGHFSLSGPRTIGLPGECVTANWVDYDNDGLADLHCVPDGLFHQSRDHRFEHAPNLVLPSMKYMAAIANWPDLNNDGSRDVLFALTENFSRWSWWQKLFKTPEDRFEWQIRAYQNTNKNSHWLQLKLIGGPGNRQAIGARVTLRTPDGPQTQEVGSSEGAFFSQGHYRLYFGLGRYARAEEIRIRWPGGRMQEIKNAGGDTLIAIEQEPAGPRTGAPK